MKKQLIVMAGLTAMFAACTNEDVLENFGTNEVAKTEGITFSIVDGVESRGDFKMDEATKKFVANWNAEVDYINVAHIGVKKNGVPVETWNGMANADGKTASVSVAAAEANHLASAVYKATKTAAKGEFTSLDNANLLTFYKTTKPVNASFRAYRGPVTELGYATDAEKKESISLVTSVGDQFQSSATKAPFDNFVMVSDPINEICELDYAVGESLPLSFERVFAGLAIKTTGYDAEVYGNLVSVEVSMDKSKIAATATIEMAAKKDGKWSYTTSSETNSVTLSMDANGNGSDDGASTDAIEWSDDAYAFIQILPVTREKAEDYTVTLIFENGSVPFELTSSKNWVANNFYTLNLDLTNTGDYLYNSTTKKLVVIKKMPAATEVSGATEVIANVALSADELKELNKLTNVTTLTLANDAASLGEDLANIKDLKTSLSTLTLTAATTAPAISEINWPNLSTLNCLAATEIPAEAYNGNNTITKYYFPVVETIGESAFVGTDIIAVGVGGDNVVSTIAKPSETEQVANTLRIGTYTIKDDLSALTGKISALTTIGEGAFDGLTGLTYIDAPAVTTFDGNPFGTSCALTNIYMPAMNWNEADVTARFLAIMSNTALKEIDLTGTTALGGSNISLANKAALVKVILAEGAEIGSSAFAKAESNSDPAIEFVNLNKIASVGDGAFGNVSFATANLNINLDVTTIGKKAFANTNIKSFDFAGVTTIGEGAFSGCTALTSANVPSVETIEKNTFKGCIGLTYIMFGSATTVKADALSGITANVTITFSKSVTIDGLPFGAMTADATNVGSEEKPILATFSNYTLDVNDAQEGVDGNTLTWVSGEKYYKATFAGIL